MALFVNALRAMVNDEGVSIMNFKLKLTFIALGTIVCAYIFTKNMRDSLELATVVYGVMVLLNNKKQTDEKYIQLTEAGRSQVTRLGRKKLVLVVGLILSGSAMITILGFYAEALGLNRYALSYVGVFACIGLGWILSKRYIKPINEQIKSIEEKSRLNNSK